jgi:hypothetical protein
MLDNGILLCNFLMNNSILPVGNGTHSDASSINNKSINLIDVDTFENSIGFNAYNRIIASDCI